MASIVPPSAIAVVQRARAAGRPVIVGTAAFLAAWPLLHVLHELMVVATASLLHGIATFPPLYGALLAAPLDPIYTAAALEMVGQIRVAGVAVAAPLGGLLHIALPAIFTVPELASGAWAEAVIWRGSTVMARGLALFAADVALLAVGMLMVRLALRERPGPWSALVALDRPSWMAVFGLLVQVQVALRLATSLPSPAQMEAAGTSFALGVLFPSFTGRQMVVSDLPAALPGPLLPLLLGLLAISAAYAAALLLLRAAVAANQLTARLGQRVPLVRAQPSHLQRHLSRGALIALALMVTAGLIAGRATPSEPLPSAAGEEVIAAQSTEPEALPNAAESNVLPAPLPPSPSVVAIVGEDYNFAYLVNGEPQVIRGMGYNPVYATLDRQDRARRCDRDFALMRQAGVNTVFGWVNAEFDNLTLDKAQEHGMGVAMPYELSPTLDYTNPEVQATLRRDVLEWVERYKRHPALRVWSVGNEVLHKIVYPSWLPLKKNSPQAIAQAKAFAGFYVELITLMHRADPTHPVLLRDAEDVYLHWVRDALQSDGVPRKWFIYGVNVYTNRLKEVVDTWPRRKMNAPLLISEFAPGGLGPKSRPEGYRTMWQAIRRHPEWTLGGVPYVWTTAGPEEVDRAFGLVDASGKPVDGSLEAIGGMFGAAEKPVSPVP